MRALIPVLPSTDTLKVLDRNRETGVLSTTEETLDRSRIFGAQTPQIFYSEDLKEAYSEPFDPLFTDIMLKMIDDDVHYQMREGLV